MQFTGETEVLGIFGDPVKHSLSPLMQNAAIRASHLDAVYVPFHVTPAQLCDAIAGIRALGLRGVNLTIPHKEAALPLVDAVDEQAALIGAINTIVNRHGQLIGYNTDGHGLLSALKQDLDVDVRGKRVLLLGAGGAGRSALVALCQSGAAWIGLANRTRKRSQGLIENLAPRFPGTAFAEFPLSTCLSRAVQEPADLLVNASALGMAGESCPVRLSDCLAPGAAVFDMVYTAEPTPLLNEARQAGLAAANGLGMLAGQGEAAFKLWFGTAPMDNVMRRALLGKNLI